jgi:hypothetical protein
MTFLNKLLAEGYSINSHSLAVRLDEYDTYRDHVYVMERQVNAVPEEKKESKTSP